jgi:hypothetical protein
MYEEAELSTVKSMCESDAERVETIRRWHIDQVVSAKVTTVALLNIAVNFDGEIRTNGLCIEREHAQIMLPELRRLIRQIEAEVRRAPVAVIS